MKALRWIPITFMFIAAAACAAETGASDPAGSPTTETRPIVTSAPATIRPLPTSTAAPTRTVDAVRTPVPTRVPLANVTAAPTATARVVTATPSAPTPTSIPPTTVVIVNNSTVTPVPTAVVVSSPEDSYTPSLSYSYTLPEGWSQTVVGETIVLRNATGTTKVTISERTIDRWRYPDVNVFGVTNFPERPRGWDTWYSASTGLIKGGQAYEFQFTGAKNNVPYNNFVQWYLWGDVNVEVDAEILSSDWNAGGTDRYELLTFLESYKAHVGGPILTVEDVLGFLEERLDDRPAGVYVRDEVIRGRVEITCRQLFEDFLNQPEYVGNGTWQAVAYTVDGAETWWVYEPTGTIAAVNSNHSKC